jgi:hypothetical protein
MEHIFKLAKLPDYNIRLITETLKDMGVTSRKGRPYAKSYVHKILTNPFYIGINRFNGKEYAGAQEPIISRELFYELQEKIHRPSYGRSKKHNPIFKGVIRCTDCGGTVTWQTQKGRSYGACRRASDVCKRWPMLREDRAEDQVIEVLNGIKDRNGDKLAKVSLALNIEQEVYASAYRARVMKALNAQLGRLRTMEDALYEDKLVGLISEERYREKLVDFADQAEQITARLAKLSEAQPAQVLDEDSRSKNKIAALYIRSVPNKKRIILSVLFAGAVLRDGFVVLELK